MSRSADDPASPAIEIGLLVFPGLTQLDLTGPYEVFQRVPQARVQLIAKTLEPVVSEHGLPILPTCTLKTCPPLTVLVVPGGPSIERVLLDDEWVSFVQRSAASARYVGAVCTGSLLLGAAGLLRNRRATSHWLAVELLESFGAKPERRRVVFDGPIATGGGVTAGIDFALSMVAAIAGEDLAREIQLTIEYAPEPPFECGTPATAGRELEAALRAKWGARQQRRLRAVQEAQRKLDRVPSS